jgi:hypothetical protein
MAVRKFLAVMNAKNIAPTLTLIQNVQAAYHSCAELMIDLSPNERLIIDEDGNVSFYGFNLKECEKINSFITLCNPEGLSV